MEKTMASLQAFFFFLPRAPKFPLPLPFLTPASQATVNEGQTEVVIYDLAQKRGTTKQNTKLKE